MANQISEIEHLMKMLHYEVAQQTATKEKVDYIVKKEQEMQQRKDTDEHKLVKTLLDDVSVQTRQLNS